MRNNDKPNCITRFLFIFSVLFLCSAYGLTAQFTVYGIAKTDNVKKHGKVITYEPLKSVVMDCQGDTLTFDLNKYDFKFTTRKPPKPYIFPDGVNYSRVSLGVLPSTVGDGGYVSYSYHHQRSRFIGYGGRLAFENYGDTEGYDFIVPGAVFYSYLTRNNTAPFIKLSAGYGIAIKNSSKDQIKAQGGINLGAALGLRLSTNRIMIDFTVGAKFQKAYYEFDFVDFSKTSDARFRRFDFSIGFMW
jgi:hypothetical protein